MPTEPSISESSSKSIGDIIDEALGIRGPEDLLRLVLVGVGIAITVVALFILNTKTYSRDWWLLMGFEVIAVLLCASTVYVVYVVLPTLADRTGGQEGKKDL